jgi:hypothetical protein
MLQWLNVGFKPHHIAAMVFILRFQNEYLDTMWHNNLLEKTDRNLIRILNRKTDWKPFLENSDRCLLIGILSENTD